MLVKTVICLITIFLMVGESYSRSAISGDRYEQLSGVRNIKTRAVTNYKTGANEDFSTGSPAWFLAEN